MPNYMKRLGILGSTGSIGRSCLRVVAEWPERFPIVSLTAGENVDLMAAQVMATKPAFVSMATEQAAHLLRIRLQEANCRSLPEIAFGPEGMKKAATLPQVDLVLSSTVGVAGLLATYEAVVAGKQVALANKEVLVAAGELVTAAARERGIELLPVDSEHNGVHQCLRAGRKDEFHNDRTGGQGDKQGQQRGVETEIRFRAGDSLGHQRRIEAKERMLVLVHIRSIAGESGVTLSRKR